MAVLISAAIGIGFYLLHSHREKILNELIAETSLSRSVCQLALRNDPGAQFQVGLAYIQNTLDKNQSKAFSWLMKAADQGDASSQNLLGVMYYDGRGVSKNKAEAAKWFRLAADQGEAHAQENLDAMGLERHIK